MTGRRGREVVTELRRGLLRWLLYNSEQSDRSKSLDGPESLDSPECWTVGSNALGLENARPPIAAVPPSKTAE
ncbi:MAG: hypothetical protein JO362_07785 [Streptomycetaceae bacterium]|nr:hypothetical protein [Streptomycetaceae bacterium]